MYQHTQNYLRYECVVIYILPTFYIPQDRLKTILNELIELASLIKLSRLFQARMEDIIGLYL